MPDNILQRLTPPHIITHEILLVPALATLTVNVEELSTVRVGIAETAIGVADELSIVIVMVGNDSTFSEGIDDTDTEDVPSAVVVPSAFALLEVLELLLPPDLLHIVSTKPRIATKNNLP